MDAIVDFFVITAVGVYDIGNCVMGSSIALMVLMRQIVVRS